MVIFAFAHLTLARVTKNVYIALYKTLSQWKALASFAITYGLRLQRTSFKVYGFFLSLKDAHIFVGAIQFGPLSSVPLSLCFDGVVS